jgi:hypothetical protein
VLTAKAKKKIKPKKQQPPKTQRKRLVLLVSLDYQLPRTFEERSFPPVPFRVIVNVALTQTSPKIFGITHLSPRKLKWTPHLSLPPHKKKVGKKCKRGAEINKVEKMNPSRFQRRTKGEFKTDEVSQPAPTQKSRRIKKAKIEKKQINTGRP